MPEYLAPGVYVEEVQASHKPIEGVSTSTAGLVGVTERGPVDVPQLVTSVGEYQRLFGGLLPQDEFTDPAGRSHAYLPHAIEGFFLNGGKRAWVSRVLPDTARRASRLMFHADPLNSAVGRSVLLRTAQQNTGTAVNLPRLYVLDPANLAIGDWLRVGDGSRADYRRVQAVGASQQHVALRFPLHASHPAGAPTRLVAITPAAPAINLTLQQPISAGASVIVVSGSAASITNLNNALSAAGSRQLLQVGSTAAAAEYVHALSASALGSTSASVTLAQPLRLDYPAGATVRGMSIPAGANVNLDLAASAGDSVVYGPSSSDTTRLLVVGVGSAQEEVHAVGQLATLPLAVPAYAAYPAGSSGRRVTAAVDQRQVVAIPSNRVVPLDSVAGMAAGMVFARGSDVGVVATVDPLLGLVRLIDPLPGAALAAGAAVTVGGIAANVVGYPTRSVLPLNSVHGVEVGMTLVHGANNGVVTSVIPDLRVVTLAAPLAGIVAAGDAVTVGGNPFTAQAMLRADVIPLDNVDGLVAGMNLTISGNSRPISAINTTVGVAILQSPLPAVPAAATAASLDQRQLTEAASAGARTLALDNRLGLVPGDVLRIGSSPNEEYLSIARSLGEQGVAPDAGALQLVHALQGDYPAGTQVSRVSVSIDATRQPALLALPVAAGGSELLVSDGSSYAANDLLRFHGRDGVVYLHRLNGAAIAANPRELTLDAALEHTHAAGEPALERDPLFEVRALDAGAWGDRLMVSCREEAGGLAPGAAVLAANPPPGPGLFSSLQLTTLNGIEPGTILELLDPDGVSVNGAPLLKARALDRPNRRVLLDPPGLQPAHMNAVAAALAAGRFAQVRSREFSLTVMLRQRPDPAVPTRDDNLLDQEAFRLLSMDPRHSRYIERVIGATFSPGAPADDAGLPLRRWDRRSEGASAYIRLRDLAAVANRQAIRPGPEALVDPQPSGLARPARHRLSGGSDDVSLMNDALYVGADHHEPNRRTGLYALKNPQDLSLVAVPGQTTASVQQALIDHCEAMRYRFAVLDGPAPANDTLSDVQNLRSRYDTRYAALYHPWLTRSDPFPTGLARDLAVPPSGHMLGVYARVDNERGVHKAPANEVVRGITGLTRYFSRGEQDLLNPYPTNVNVIRDFRTQGRGIRVWGARCITSDEEYKYINVRRLLIFLEDSIDRGLQWVVFEPNADELWARVRRSVSNFLTTVWRNGALEGTTPEQGFFVKCDRTTMTRDDLDNGRLVCVIGVAPVKPAEFVIIRLGLWTADATS
ncbi:phage tail sheath subtilisin-like domain-containing protein [Chitinimonas lacunae]|uniref:Phage tail sheath subtilisin-like domain-containing protein n=1 Tax=Chitinimonas lacunae TaxID=1963018 RepID=A0ABV8MN21_9NEIS